MSTRVENVCIVFDGPPSVEGGRFVEAEDADGHSISIGRWEENKDGFWRLWLDAERVAGVTEQQLLNVEAQRDAALRDVDTMKVILAERFEKIEELRAENAALRERLK